MKLSTDTQYIAKETGKVFKDKELELEDEDEILGVIDIGFFSIAKNKAFVNFSNDIIEMKIPINWDTWKTAIFYKTLEGKYFLEERDGSVIYELVEV